MNGQDELQELWGSQPSVPKTKGEDLMRMVEVKTKKFDRMVKSRNKREIIGSVFAMVVLGWTMLGSHDPWKLTGGVIIEVGLAMIIFVLLRYGTAGPELDPSGSLSDYSQALLERFDRQIRLLKLAKYWYLAPIFVGLGLMELGSVLAKARAGTLGPTAFIWPAILAVFLGSVWWLNEVYAVGKLRKYRGKVEAMLRGEDVGGEAGCY